MRCLPMLVALAAAAAALQPVHDARGEPHPVHGEVEALPHIRVPRLQVRGGERRGRLLHRERFKDAVNAKFRENEVCMKSE